MKNIKSVIILFFIFLTHLTVNSTNPVVTNVSILGEGLYNSTPNPDQSTILTGDYDFSDADGHTDASTYAWYIDLNDNGDWTDDGAAVATTIRYTVTSTAITHNVFFVVTPLDSNGESDGIAVASVGSPVFSTSFTDYDSDVNVTISSDDDWLNGWIKQNRTLTVNNGATLTVHGDLDLTTGGISIFVSNGASLIINGQLITENNLSITVDATSTFVVNSGLDARNNSALNISGDMTVNGDVSVVQNASFTIADGGSLDVSGDLTTGDNADLTIEGDVTVDGDVSVGNNTDIVVDGTLPAGGTLVIGGDLSGGTGSTLTGDGPVTVGGDVSGPIVGDDQLPVELISFTANYSNNAVQLNWTTAAELNNDYFTIERSADGIHFETIIQTPGQGNSSVIVNYTEYDYNPLDGISYYRLKQTDFDGKFEYSNIIGVNTSLLKSENTVNVFPNPFSLNGGLLNIQVNDFDAEENINIRVIDITGRIIYESTESSGSESFIRTIQFENNITKGTYFVIISNTYEQQVNKLLIH